MNQHGRLRRALLHVVTDQVPKVDEQVSGVRNAVVRPGREMELSQRVTLTRLHLKAKERGERPRGPSEVAPSLETELHGMTDTHLHRSGYNVNCNFTLVQQLLKCLPRL